MGEVWDLPPEGSLGAGEIHLWSARLGQLASLRDTFAPLLSPDEHDRAGRFAFPELRERFMLGRGWVRHILGLYLGVEAWEVAFRYGLQGKPYLAAPYATSGLQFSVSHSAHLVLIAVGNGADVGVDLERVRPLSETASIAARYFTPGERAWLRGRSPARRHESFFLLWVCKEAVLKADGAGLTVPLDAIESVPRATGWVELTRSGNDRSDVGRWSCRTLTPEAGYVAAVAVARRPVSLVSRSWPSPDPMGPDAKTIGRAQEPPSSGPAEEDLR